MKIKSVLILMLFFVISASFSQKIYEGDYYNYQDVVSSTNKAQMYSQLLLNKDNTYNFIVKEYNREGGVKKYISCNNENGTWLLIKDTLVLDSNGSSKKFLQEKDNLYLIGDKNKLIKKVSLKFKVELIECLPPDSKYETAYDSRMKTEEMMIEERNLDGRPFVLRIAFESSLKDEHVKVCGFDFERPGEWTTYFEGKLTDCSEYSCKIVKASSSVLPIIIYINDEKIVLENSPENSPSLYKYLFVSKEGEKYKLYFSNYPKVVR